MRTSTSSSVKKKKEGFEGFYFLVCFIWFVFFTTAALIARLSVSSQISKEGNLLLPLFFFNNSCN